MSSSGLFLNNFVVSTHITQELNVKRQSFTLKLIQLFHYIKASESRSALAPRRHIT